MALYGEERARIQPHRVATVREALVVLRHSAHDLPEVGAFDDVLVEIHGDPALGASPDPEIMPDPIIWQASLMSFTSATDVDITPGYERLRALDVRVASEGGGDASTFMLSGELKELQGELAAPDMERDLYSTFHRLVEHYIDRIESGHA